jgi:Fe-S-cluster containining protein
MSDFKCLHCGECCKNLFDNIGGEKRGLTLTVEESLLFPNEIVAPLAAFGLKNPETVFLYQLSLNNCPQINKENKCAIYEKRPLVCRSFPLTQGSFSTKCTRFWFFKNFPENSVKIAIDWGTIQLNAEKQLDAYIMDVFKRNFLQGIGSWFFDLENKTWKLKKRYLSDAETVEF